MSLDLSHKMNKLIEDGIDKENLEFVDCALTISTGETIFASIAILDDESYIMSIPLILKTFDESSVGNTLQSRISFIEYCPFTNDQFTLLKSKDIISMNTLGDSARLAYLRAIKTIYDDTLTDELPIDNEMDLELNNIEIDGDTIH